MKNKRDRFAVGIWDMDGPKNTEILMRYEYFETEKLLRSFEIRSIAERF
jgi:hypothetical protein